MTRAATLVALLFLVLQVRADDSDADMTLNQLLRQPRAQQIGYFLGGVQVGYMMISALRPDAIDKPGCNQSPGQIIALLQRDDMRKLLGERNAEVAITWALLGVCGIQPK
jgi:hypothetical protein